MTDEQRGYLIRHEREQLPDGSWKLTDPISGLSAVGDTLQEATHNISVLIAERVDELPGGVRAYMAQAQEVRINDDNEVVIE